MRGKTTLTRGGLILAALFLSVLGVLGAGPGEAQAQQVRDWNQTADPLEGGIGLHYGNLGGTGLSFRVPLRWYLYFQAGGGIWHTTDDQKHNAGAQLNFLLRQDPRLRLYLSGGVGYFYHRELVGTSGGRDLWDKSKNWNVGAGVGTEYLIGPRVAIQVELDFVHEGEDGDVKVSPQLGLHFYW
jgi:hypothetical protein|nr:hypothetical protein [Candidatus Krumholzibacteria bacterium]